MTTFLRPIFSALLGLTLTIYGLSYSITGYPGAAPFGVLWASMPSLISVAMFVLGLVAVFAGLAITVTGIQGTRRRCRQLGTVCQRDPAPDAEYEEEDERYWQPRGAYR